MCNCNRDKKYIDIAKIWATNSHAIRSKVGAIIVKDGMIISDGYNGTPAGFDNNCEDIIDCGHSCTNMFTEDDRCDTCKEHRLQTKKEVLHAEANAILKLAKHGGVGTDGATLYVSLSPCFDCAKLIIQAGIKEVIYSEKYRDTSGLELLKRAGIKTKMVK